MICLIPRAASGGQVGWAWAPVASAAGVPDAAVEWAGVPGEEEFCSAGAPGEEGGGWGAALGHETAGLVAAPEAARVGPACLAAPRAAWGVGGAALMVWEQAQSWASVPRLQVGSRNRSVGRHGCVTSGYQSTVCTSSPRRGSVAAFTPPKTHVGGRRRATAIRKASKSFGAAASSASTASEENGTGSSNKSSSVRPGSPHTTDASQSIGSVVKCFTPMRIATLSDS